MITEEPTYYEQWGPIERRFRYALNTFRGRWAKELVVLVESKWRLGDEIMAIPVYRGLMERLKSSGRDVHVAAWCNYAELLERNPFVDSVNQADVEPHVYIKLRGVPRDLNRREYYRRHFNLGATLSHPRLYFEDWETPLWNEVPTPGGSVVALCRGASWETKRWPMDCWTALGRALEAAGYRVIVLGQEGEEIDVGTSFVGRTEVRDAACLLRSADLAICSDSGLMHLSLAVETRTLGLFGPTASEILIEGNADFHTMTNERECQGCWNRDLAIEEPGVCPRNIEVCMDTISVDDVVQTAASILSVEEA